MKNNKHIAFNKLFNIYMVAGLLFLWGAYALITENELGIGIGVGVIGLFFLIVPGILMPYCYSFDPQGVSLHYLFLPVERYLWKNISAIKVTEDSSSSSHPILDLMFSTVFEIRGQVEGVHKRYMKGHIRKSRRAKRFIKTYWDGTVTEASFWPLKKKDKNAKVCTYSTDEIVPMERETRAEFNEMLTPFVAQAKQYNLELKKKYVYTTEDWDELNSRPKGSYTYTLIIEIAQPNETDENRIVVVGIDLIYVRLGKTAYRGVLNPKAENELNETLTDVLKEIVENGIDVYCRPME